MEKVFLEKEKEPKEVKWGKEDDLFIFLSYFTTKHLVKIDGKNLFIFHESMTKTSSQYIS